MTVSYSVHLATARDPQATLSQLFGIEDVKPIDKAEMWYVRGKMYLAHSKVTDTKLSERIQRNYGIIPTVSVSFFPDGVSSVEKALDELLNAVQGWISNRNGDLAMATNLDNLVLKSQDNVLTTNFSHPFWTKARLEQINQIKQYRNASDYLGS
jgi:hypothetical protein